MNRFHQTGNSYQNLQIGETEIIFQEVPARFVENRQTEPHSISYWSIHEIELFSRTSSPE